MTPTRPDVFKAEVTSLRACRHSNVVEMIIDTLSEAEMNLIVSRVFANWGDLLTDKREGKPPCVRDALDAS